MRFVAVKTEDQQAMLALHRIRQQLVRIRQQLNAEASCIAQAQADLEFHEAICAASGSQMLMTIARQVLAVTITHRSRHAYTAQQLAQAQTQHESIFNAIATGDYALAKWLMSEHVSNSSELAMQHLASGL